MCIVRGWSVELERRGLAHVKEYKGRFTGPGTNVFMFRKGCVLAVKGQVPGNYKCLDGRSVDEEGRPRTCLCIKYGRRVKVWVASGVCV